MIPKPHKITVLHSLTPFSPVEDIQALIDELRAEDPVGFAGDIAQLEEDLVFAKKLEERDKNTNE